MRCNIVYECRTEEGRVWLSGQFDFGVTDEKDPRIEPEKQRLEKTGHVIKKVQLE